MRLWEILKNIDEDKVEKGTLFIGINSGINLILEYDGNSLVYNTIMSDNKTREAVALCDGEMSLDYEMIAPKIKETSIYCNKDIEIKNGIGIFEDDFIDCIYVLNNDKYYEIVPIENKFAVPYVLNGTVKVFYRKNAKVLQYNFHLGEIVIVL